MRRLRIVMICMCLIVLAATLGLSNYYNKDVINHPFKSKSGKVQVNVKQGESLYKVIDNLSENGVVNSALLMKYYIKKNKMNPNIKLGQYLFDCDISINEFVLNLNKGIFDKNRVTVTIPEGSDIEQIASILQDKGVISSKDFISSCKEYKIPQFVKSESKKKYSLEGYLFPDTYELTKGMQGKTIIDTMIKRFEFVLNTIEKEKNIKIKNDDLEKYIIIASIVEREIKVPDEREKAASVFYNRLNKKMKLESCATVEYALGVHKEKLFNSDLKVNSPYNTYIVNTLPIGPICSPGKECIEAAINPIKTNYLYFVSNNNGTHTFTDSYQKFLEVKKVTQGF